jgi:hypothetical protein
LAARLCICKYYSPRGGFMFCLFSLPIGLKQAGIIQNKC